MKKLKGNIVLGLLVLGLVFAAIGGFIANIYKLVHHAPELAAWGIEQALRVFGIIIPVVGAVLGYL